MASISPTTLSNYGEPYTGKGCYLKLHITKITQSDGATNKTYIDWKITFEGTPWVILYRAYCSLGGKVLYDAKPEKGDWRAGDTLASGSVEFTNNSDGTLSLYAYIKQQFYYGNGDTSRWTNSYYYQENSTNMVCSQIPRYCTITSFTISKKDETSVRGNWAVDANVSTAWCRHRVKGSGTWGSWVQVAWPNFDYGGLAANTTYEFQLKVYRLDSGLETQSGAVEQTTYNYPHVTGTPDFIIGNNLTIKIYNPIGRKCTFYLIGNNGEEIGGAQTTGDYMSGYTAEEVKNLLYRGIPNSQSGKYSVRLVDDLGRNNVYGGGTYYIRGDEKPTFNDSYIIDVVDNLLVDEITGNGSKIIKGHNVLTGKIVPMTLNKSANGSRYVISASANPSSQEITYGSSNKEFTLRNITTNSFSVTAYDARGLSNPATEYITLIDYNKPLVRELSINRVNGIGNYATLVAAGTFTHWTGWSEIKKFNSIQQVFMRYKEQKSNNWTQWYAITDKLKQNSNGSWDLEYKMDFEFSNTNKYDFQLYVQDLLESSITKDGVLSTANAFIWRDLKNKWFGIGKKPTCALDVAGEIKQKDNIVLDSSNLIKHRLGDDDVNLMLNRRETGNLTGVDLNNFVEPGVYGLYGAQINGPRHDSYYLTNGYQTLTVEAYSGSHMFQTLKVTGWGTCQPTVYVRSSKDDGTGWVAWGPWLKLDTYNTEQIAGFFRSKDVYGGVWGSDASGKNYLLLRTSILSNASTMNRVKIEGYAYRNQTPIHVEVVWYNYWNGSAWQIINHGWWGIGPDEVKIAQHSDSAGAFNWIQLHFPYDHYFTRIIVTEVASTGDHFVQYPNVWTATVSEGQGAYTGSSVTVPRKQ